MDSDAGSAEGLGMPTLAELIQRHRDATGSSYDELARRTDWVVNRQTFHKLATQPPRSFPKSAETVKAIAHALDSDVTTVTLAYARSLGLDVKPAGADFTRGQSDAQLVRELARRLADRLEAPAGADEVPGATSTAGEEDIDEVLFRRRAPETAHVDVDPAATERDRERQDDAGFAAFMRGEGGWDELTKRRYEERRDREAATEGVPAAARTVEQSPGRISAEESRRRGEESQDPGGDEPV